MNQEKLQKYIERARKIHGDKYSYEKTNPNTLKDDCIVTCPIHGDFNTTLDKHINGKCGCPQCARSGDKSFKKFLENARAVHGDKYDYSKVNYVNANTEITIICPIHGEFTQLPRNHVRGCGCNLCNGGGKKLTTDEYLKKVRLIYGDMYDYSKVNYQGSNELVTIICPVHGEFSETATDFLKGCGCKKCAQEKEENKKNEILKSKPKDTSSDFVKTLLELGFNIETDNSLRYKNFIFSFIPCKENSKEELNSLKESFEKSKLQPIFIYEDEWFTKKDLIVNDIKRMCGLSTPKHTVNNSNVEIKHINREVSEPFINKFNVLGYSNTSIQLGAYYKNVLIAVMIFKKDALRANGYEIVNYAINSEYSCKGIFSDMFNYFIEEYKPKEMFVFYDTRWLSKNINKELTDMGFRYEGTSTNSYWYVDESKGIRINKNSLNKQNLIKKYGFDPSLTEKEMVNNLGFKKSWDLGYTKYAWGVKSKAIIRRVLTKEEEERIVYLYEQEKKDTNYISSDVHVNKDLIYSTLDKYGIRRRKLGELNKKIGKEELANHTKIHKYVPREGYTFVAVSKLDGTTFSDYMNNSGALSRYIKENYNITPPSFYMASVYYYKNESYWYEEYFDIVERKIDEKASPSKSVLTERDFKEMVRLYVEEKQTCDAIATKFKVGKKKVYDILDKNGVQRRKLGELAIKHDKKDLLPFKDNPKYIPREGYHFVAISKKDGTMFNDYDNKGGHLTYYIRGTLGIKIPTLYERRIYYGKTGNYWHEQFFDIVEYKNDETIKCPYCDYETVDIDNKSGAMQNHIKNVHQKTEEEVVKEFPEFEKYYINYIKAKKRDETLQDDGSYVICPICSEKYKYVTDQHILNHGLSTEEFFTKYPNFQRQCDELIEKNKNNIKNGNLVVPEKRFVSQGELDIRQFLLGYNINLVTNRQILIGQEIDMLNEERKLCIEYNGIYYHSEKRGHKKNDYHYNKMIKCLEKGYKLFHVFEDEFKYKKELILSSIAHKFHLNNNLEKIMGRKCEIKQISSDEAFDFLIKNTIQIFKISQLYIGAYYQDKLIGVASFIELDSNINSWELDCFATDYHYVCQGVIGKMLSFFKKNFNPYEIITYADRRWTQDIGDNIFEKLGFIFDKFEEPNFRYANMRYISYDKLIANKDLLRTYGCEYNTSDKYANSNYDKLWDCGQIKYIWKKD